MCGRFAADASVDELVAFFAVEHVDGPMPGPRYNIAPTMDIAAVVGVRDVSAPVRHLRSFRWGLVPSWATDPRRGARLINARAETVAQKPSFRSAFSRRRCLIPALGYYEWSSAAVGLSGRKQPFFLRPRSGELLAMAGVYEVWRGEDGEPLATAAIITKAAIDEVGTVHDRMPMVVAGPDWDDWLDPETSAADASLIEAQEVCWEIYPVSAEVNRVGKDAPALVEPLSGME